MNKFTFLFTLMQDRVDIFLDNILKHSIDSGLQQVSSDEYEIKVVFKNGTIMVAWNVNKYYAWLNRGKFFIKGKNSTYNQVYEWINSRPKKSTMYKLYKVLKEFK